MKLKQLLVRSVLSNLLLVLVLSPGITSAKLRIPIGTIFSKSPGWKDVFEAMNIAVEGHKSRNGSADFDMKFYVDKIDTVDAYKLTKIICTQVYILLQMFVCQQSCSDVHKDFFCFWRSYIELF